MDAIKHSEGLTLVPKSSILKKKPQLYSDYIHHEKEVKVISATAPLFFKRNFSEPSIVLKEAPKTKIDDIVVPSVVQCSTTN